MRLIGQSYKKIFCKCIQANGSNLAGCGLVIQVDTDHNFVIANSKPPVGFHMTALIQGS